MSDYGGGGGAHVSVGSVCGPFFSKLLVCTIAASCVLGLSYPTWRVVQDVPELQAPPYDARIVTAVKYAFSAAAFNLPWGFVFCLLAILTLAAEMDILGFVLSLFLGCIDVVSLSLLAASMTWHWKLLGRPFHSCGESGHPYEDGTPSFFTVVGTHVGKSPEGVCQDLSKAFVAEAALAGTTGAGIMMLLGLFCQAFCLFPRIIALLFRGIYRGIAWVLGRIWRRLRFAVGYAGKLGRRRATFNVGKQSKVNDVEMGALPSPLARVLELKGKAEKSLLLASYLHFADIMSLSMVKALRGTLIRSGGFDVEGLRRETCVKGTKSDCWSCGNQICQDCTYDRELADPETTEHVENCITVCSSCYYEHCCGPSRPRLLQPGLSCRHVRAAGSGAIATAQRKLCSLCSKRRPDDIRASRRRKEAEELRQLESATAFCAVCQASLPKASPRWWACSVCKTECKSRVHTQWVKERPS